MQILYGTTNAAKLDAMKRHLRGMDIELIGLNDIDSSALRAASAAIDESGNDPLENARIKARAYYKAYGKPVFSCDSGLYCEGLPDDLQPGVHVRNVNGKRLDDAEMISYYSGLAAKMGGQLVAYYWNAICLIVDEARVYEYTGDDISSERFLIMSVPHEIMNPGFPIDSLSVHIASGKYYYDMKKEDEHANNNLLSTMDNGFRRFFERSIQDVKLG